MRRSRRGGGIAAPVRARVLTLALAFVGTACGKGDQSRDSARADSARVAGSAHTTATSASAQPSPTLPCPRTGHWIACQVRERLIRSGLAPRDTNRTALPSLGPAPLVYRLGKGGLAVYLFADSAARARAATTLDTVKYVRVERGPTVLSQASVIQNDNLLGLLFSKNEQQIERVSDALTAGPPQP